jgi:hypothetical protein
MRDELGSAAGRVRPSQRAAYPRSQAARRAHGNRAMCGSLCQEKLASETVVLPVRRRGSDPSVRRRTQWGPRRSTGVRATCDLCVRCCLAVLPAAERQPRVGQPCGSLLVARQSRRMEDDRLGDAARYEQDSRIRLADFSEIADACRTSEAGFTAFKRTDRVRALGWPADVLEQWLYDHSDNGPFLNDYGIVDLSQIHWGLEALQASDIAAMPTGPSDGDVIDEFAANPDHWISVRNSGAHTGVAQMWELHRTWKRWPIFARSEPAWPTEHRASGRRGAHACRNPQGPPQAGGVRRRATLGMGWALPRLTARASPMQPSASVAAAESCRSHGAD